MRRAGLLAIVLVGAAAAALVVLRDDGHERREPVRPRRLEVPPDPRGVGAWTRSRDVYKFRNRDGVWWIFRRCVDRRVRGRRWTVGPAYVARFRDRDGRLLVDDFVPRADLWSPGYLNAVNGGLGTFGVHYARGVPGETPAGDDPTTPRRERRVDRAAPGYALEGRMCAWSNRRFGVTRVRELGAPTRVGDAVRFAVDVEVTDARRPPLIVLRYRYRFLPTSVRQSLIVETHGRGRGRTTVFVKEPKVVAMVRGGGFRRMAVFGSAFQKGVLEGAPQGTPVLSTGHAANPNRRAVRWDYGRWATRDDPRACARAACFEAAVEAAPGVPWEKGRIGFDGWAVASARRAATWPRDTRGAGVAWNCTRRPSADGVRRWEFGGWKRRNPRDPLENPHPYRAAEASFIGWEGGRGPRDCEPLERALSPRVERWSALLTYRLVRAGR